MSSYVTGKCCQGNANFTGKGLPGPFLLRPFYGFLENGEGRECSPNLGRGLRSTVVCALFTHRSLLRLEATQKQLSVGIKVSRLRIMLLIAGLIATQFILVTCRAARGTNISTLGEFPRPINYTEQSSVAIGSTLSHIAPQELR